MSESKAEARPKVTLALSDEKMLERVLSVLADADVEVEVIEDTGDIAESVQESDGDIVLVSGEDIDPSDLDALTDDDDGPSVAVIGESDPSTRADLLAAGAARVLTGEEAEEDLGMSLEALAEAEAAGGLSGPEVGGADAQPRLADFLTQSPRMREFVDLVQRVIPASTSLLITGPTGVGKERLARAIHAEGPRAEGPFVGVNCAALPEQLLESELFGHRKGAFTGAEDHRRGHFELADGGTIFLDEIGEMPMHLQVKLLTVLQRHEVTPVGAETPIRVDVRVMVATNRDLEEEIAQGRFREDLFYRLNVVPLRIPPLSERPEDVPDLAGRFINHFRSTMPTSKVERISDAAVQCLMQYGWPGNVRELINVVERAMLLSEDAEITLADLPPAIAQGDPAASAIEPQEGPASTEIPPEWGEMPIREVRDLAIRRAEIAYLRMVLARTSGHLAKAAKHAGLGARALYEKLKRYDIRKEDFKNSGS